MKTTQLEESLRSLSINPSSPLLIVAIPLIVIATADQPVSLREQSRITRFFDGFGFQHHEVTPIRRWLESPPQESDLIETLHCIRALRGFGDAIAVENSVLTHVLLEAESILREAGPPEARPRGRALLAKVSEELQLELGSPWDELAPGTLDETPGSSELNRTSCKEKEKQPLRRLRTARRLDTQFQEKGGII